MHVQWRALRPRAFAVLVTACSIVSPIPAAGGSPPAPPVDTAPATPHLALRVNGSIALQRQPKDRKAIAWIDRKAHLAFGDAFPGTVVVAFGEVPTGATLAYEVTGLLTRSQEGYRFRLTLKQLLNPLAAPTVEERTFANELDPVDIEEFLRETAKLFAKVVQATSTPMLVPLVAPAPGVATSNAVPVDTAPATPAALDASGVVAVADAVPSPAVPIAPVVSTLPIEPEGVATVTPLPPATVEVAGEPPAWRTPWFRYGAFAAAGLGAVAIGLGGWQASELQAAGRDFRDARSQLEEIDAQRRGRDAASRANAAFAVGGILAAAGAGILVADYIFDAFHYAER